MSPTRTGSSGTPELSDRLWDKIRNDEPLTRRLSADAISAEDQASRDGTPVRRSVRRSSPSGSTSPSDGDTTPEEAEAAEANGLCA